VCRILDRNAHHPEPEAQGDDELSSDPKRVNSEPKLLISYCPVSWCTCNRSLIGLDSQPSGVPLAKMNCVNELDDLHWLATRLRHVRRNFFLGMRIGLLPIHTGSTHSSQEWQAAFTDSHTLCEVVARGFLTAARLSQRPIHTGSTHSSQEWQAAFTDSHTLCQVVARGFLTAARFHR
jgi:hypothetical protein